jgi:hypothetical protein
LASAETEITEGNPHWQFDANAPRPCQRGGETRRIRLRFDADAARGADFDRNQVRM